MEIIENKLYSKIFMWMFIGLLVTFGTGFYVSTNENMIYNIFSTRLYWVIFVAEFITVIVLSVRIQKMSQLGAQICFILYSFLTGLTFAAIFLMFEMSSIIYVFLATSLIFGIFAFIGYTTNVDLTKLGTILFMGLLGIIIVSIINIFVGNSMLDLLLNWVGVIIFVGYIAYDLQKIKNLSNSFDEDKLAIYGALQLYLDFINLFIRLLELFGKRRD